MLYVVIIRHIGIVSIAIKVRLTLSADKSGLQDEHPLSGQRMPSFGSNKVEELIWTLKTVPCTV